MTEEDKTIVGPYSADNDALKDLAHNDIALTLSWLIVVVLIGYLVWAS